MEEPAFRGLPFLIAMVYIVTNTPRAGETAEFARLNAVPRFAQKPSRAAAAAAAVSLVGLASGCDSAQDNAFTMPIPPETRIIEHPPVSDEARQGKVIAVHPDLQINGSGDDAADIFLKVTDVAVDANGSIFVYDAGRFTIEEFTATGEHLHTFGGTQGEGPGDLGERGQIAVAGESLVYVEQSRLNRWDLTTRSLSLAARLPVGTFIRDAHGTDAGPFVLAFARPFPGTVGSEVRTGWGLAAFHADGTELARYAMIREPGRIYYFNRTDSGFRMVYTGFSRGDVEVVAARDSRVYLTQGDRYQVLALDISGRSRWAFRIDWPREPLTEVDIEQSRARTAGVADITGLAADWPDTMPALSVSSRRMDGRGHAIRVDGHGNLYVFPFVRGEPERRPVDVYDPDGQRLFAGFIPTVSWMAAHGDHIYGIETDPSGDQRVVRYRLEPPFDNGNTQ